MLRTLQRKLFAGNIHMKPWQLAYDIETVGFHAVANNKTAAVIATRFYQ